jgi:DNA-directed RNA polymerase sigma subunit (sigma70/sigma32)
VKNIDFDININCFLAESEKVKPLIDEWLSTLAQVEREIVKLRHGLTDAFEHSCEEIGMRFGITPERVADVDTVALAKLKEIGRRIGTRKIKGETPQP